MQPCRRMATSRLQGRADRGQGAGGTSLGDVKSDGIGKDRGECSVDVWDRRLGPGWSRRDAAPALAGRAIVSHHSMCTACTRPEAASALYLSQQTERTHVAKSTARGIRVPGDLQEEIEREMERRGIGEWSTMVVELLEEAVRMRRAPGIVFVDGATGRRPVVAGSGLEVWEVVATWKEVGRNYERLRTAYDWLTEPQLRGALSYYEMYEDEVEGQLARENALTLERVQHDLPFTKAR